MVLALGILIDSHTCEGGSIGPGANPPTIISINNNLTVTRHTLNFMFCKHRHASADLVYKIVYKTLNYFRIFLIATFSKINDLRYHKENKKYFGNVVNRANILRVDVSLYSVLIYTHIWNDVSC